MITINLAKRRKQHSSTAGTSTLTLNTDGLRQALDMAKGLPLQKLAIAAIVAGVATYFVNNYEDTQVQALQLTLNKLNAEKPRLQAQTDKMQGLEALKKSMESDELTIRTKLETIQKLIANRGQAAGVLLELSKVTPPGVWFTGFTFNGNDVSMKGFSTDFSQISDFMKELSESSVFTNPTLKDTQTSQDDQKQNVASFEIDAKRR